MHLWRSCFALFALTVSFVASGNFVLAQPAPSPNDTKSAGSVARSEALPEGFTKDAEMLYAKVMELNRLAEAAKTAGAEVVGIAIKRLPELEQAAAQYSRFHGACVKTQATASVLCREKTSPHLQDSLNQINTLMGMVGGMAVKDACSNAAEVMRLAQAGLTLYTASCTAARASCEASCSQVKANLDRIATILEKQGEYVYHCDSRKICNVSPDFCLPAQAACENLRKAVADGFNSAITAVVKKELNKNVRESIALKYDACTYQYAQMIVSAGVGLMSVANSIKQGQKCDEATNGTGTNQTNGPKAEKCEDPANASLSECICRANPRTPGCSNAYQKPNESSSVGLPGTDSGGRSLASKESGPNLGGAGIPGLENAAKNDGSGSSVSGVGAPSGGGGGAGLGGGGGGGGSGKGVGTDEAPKAKLNANILGSGGGGGGGGGGSWGAGGMGGGASDQYRAYLPGGDKDPSKGLAGQQSWRNEVTGQGGKSNWEKVKDRYRDNSNSLFLDK